MIAGYQVAVDYGTTFTAATVTTATASGSGSAEVVEFGAGHGSRYLSSAVVATPEGELVVGHRALARATRVDPALVCRTPKRQLQEREVVLGDHRFEPTQVVAATLSAVADEVRRRHGGEPPERVVMTHPAVWSRGQVERLGEAARHGGLAHEHTEIEFVAEPVAAAAYYTSGGQEVPAGAKLAVYDLGGGTFDCAVLAATGGGGFEVVGRPGGDPNLGGEDIDEALTDWVAERIEAIDRDAWASFANDTSSVGLAGAATLRDELRQAKEELSRAEAVEILLPAGVLPTESLTMRREELNELIGDVVDATIDALADTLTDAGVSPGDIHALYLTGGSSRIPAIASRIHASLEVTPTTHADPKAVTPLGAHLAVRRDPPPTSAAPPTPGSASPAQEPPAQPGQVVMASKNVSQGFSPGSLELTTEALTFRTWGGTERFRIPASELAGAQPAGTNFVDIQTATGGQRVKVSIFQRAQWVQAINSVASGRQHGPRDEGWHADPTGRFEFRYFDGVEWTRFAARDGVTLEDPL